MTSEQGSSPDYSGRIPRKRTLMARLRTNLLTGIVIVAPFGLTLYLAWTLIGFVDRNVVPYVMKVFPWLRDTLLFSIPGIGLVVFVLSLIVVGSLAKNFFGRAIIKIGESWVDRLPIVRSIYNALKQIAETIFTESSNNFERACIVQYPRKDMWAIAFVSCEAKGEVPHKSGDERRMISVFLPTTPNPTSGFLLFVPEEDVVYLDMSVEDAAKLVISAGLIAPPAQQAGQAPSDAPESDKAAVIEPPKPIAAEAAAALEQEAARVEARRPFSLRHRRVDRKTEAADTETPPPRS